jgi:pimeloyl-ACP methyl ester carboxylesterase
VIAPAPADGDPIALPGPWRHRWVSANGIRLHVAEAGDERAPRVLLLHGFPEFWWSWRHQLTALAADHHVVACDLRGYGGSDRPPRGYDLWTLAGDVAGLIRSLGGRRAAVVGAGWGGAVAWTLTTLHPGAVSRLAVLGAPHPLALRRSVPRDPLHQGRALAPALFFQLPRLPERRLRADDAALVPSLLADGAGAAWADAPEFAAIAERHRAAMTVPRVSHCALEYFRWAVRSQFRPDGRRFAAAVDRPVGVPVLQVQGADDPWVLERTARGSQDWCGGERTYRLLDGVGHFPHQEAPRHTTLALQRFLGASGS